MSAAPTARREEHVRDLAVPENRAAVREQAEERLHAPGQQNERLVPGGPERELAKQTRVKQQVKEESSECQKIIRRTQRGPMWLRITYLQATRCWRPRRLALRTNLKSFVPGNRNCVVHFTII